MIMYNMLMDKNKGAFLRGFTIIEVMLFLALSGVLLAGILGGLGGNIARQRYNDAVQDIANMMRDQYSFVSDTQIAQRNKEDSYCYGLVQSDVGSNDAKSYFRSLNSSSTDNKIAYRGRTNCVIYGAVVSITEKYIETTELIGRDYKTIVKQREGTDDPVRSDLSDIQILKDVVSANNVALHCNLDDSDDCYVRSADNSRTQNTKWGTRLLDPKGKPIRKTLMIIRSPRDGSIRTYVWNDGIKGGLTGLEYVRYEELNAMNDGKGQKFNVGHPLDSYGINRHLTDANFKIQALDICVDSGDSQTYSNARRLIKIKKAGMGQSAVELMNLDAEREISEGGVDYSSDPTLGVAECQ